MVPKLKVNFKPTTHKDYPLGLQTVSRGWFNNNAESMNHVLKNITNWMTLPLSTLIAKLHEKVDDQETEVERAMFDTGEFKLANLYQKFEVPRETWISMTNTQRKKHMAKFYRKVWKKKQNQCCIRQSKNQNKYVRTWRQKARDAK